MGLRHWVSLALLAATLGACRAQGEKGAGDEAQGPTTIATLAPSQERPSAAAVRPTARTASATAPTASAPTPSATVAGQEPTAPADDPATPRATAQPQAQPEATTPAGEQPADEMRYVFPIQPPTEATYGVCHHDYPASDIFVPDGSRFVAVTGGVVEYVSYEDTWDPDVDEGTSRGGLSVALLGDDGVRYYGSHLQEIAAGIEPGVRVTAGDLLGLTGHSGSARPTPPHLHFGISHPTTPDDWATRRGEINPYPYLNLWRKGVMATPDLTVTGEGAC